MGLLEAFAHVSHPTQRLLRMTDKWSRERGDRDAPVHEALQIPCYQPKQQPSLAEQLGEAGMAQLVARYRAGATQQELADYYGASASSVKRLIHSQGAQLWHRRPSRAS